MGRAHKSTAVISAFFIFNCHPIGIATFGWGKASFFAPQFEYSISGRFVQSFFNLMSGVEKRRLKKP
jgi:hypothetical protein